MRMFAHVMNADLDANRRRTSRRSLMLDSVVQKDDVELAEIVIRNLSQTGLLMESHADFGVGEIFYLHLPELGATPAQIRWKDDAKFGCEFLTPVSKAVIAAAVLKSAFDLEEDEKQSFAEPQAAAKRFFADQLLPTDQQSGMAVYLFSVALAAMLIAVAAVMANGSVVIS